MHRHEQTDVEAVNELPAAQRVAVAYSTIDGKHRYVKGVGNLTYVFQFP